MVDGHLTGARSRPEASRRKFFIVYNPLSGRNRRGLLDDVCAAIAARGGSATVATGQDFETIRDLARTAARSGTDSGAYDAIVAAGGDGTIRATAAGLVGSDVPLGVVALGTGNVLGNEVGLPRQPDAIADMLLGGPTVTLSCGSLAGVPFLLMVSAGFDAGIVPRLRQRTKRLLGKLAYARPVLAQFAERPRPFTVLIDGKAFTCTWLVVSNARHYAGSFILAPERSVTAPGFTALVVTAATRTGLLRVMLAIAMGQPPPPSLAALLPCREIEVPDAQGIPIQVDGDAVVLPSVRIAGDKIPLRLITSATCPLLHEAPASPP